MKLNSTQVRSENSLKVINKYISFSDKAKNEAGEMYIYGDIADEKWFDEDVTPKSIRDALSELGAVKNLDIHINSYGGSCIAGNAIINILDNYRKKNGTSLNVYIEGIAASMGSGIASVGNNVYMADNALYMIHKPWSFAIGNADDMRKEINVLDTVEDTLVANYMRRFNGTEDELRKMMADETWLTAEEAKEHGFVDEIIEGANVAASATGIKIGNQVFENKVADMIKNKYPDIKLEEEEKKLTYDQKLGEFGITEDMFATLDMESDKILSIVDMVKESFKPEPVESFMDKETALNKLGCEDITAEEVLNYAKAGMHPVDTTEISNKANEYDKIVASAKETALNWAIKAQGDSYNESRMKKYLDVLDYSEIVAQTDAWKEESKKILNAGKRVSVRSDAKPQEEPENLKDYKFF